MCELCSNDKQTVDSARRQAFRTADRLEDAVMFYRKMGSGAAKPHGAEAERMSPTIRALIRVLVDEWV